MAVQTWIYGKPDVQYEGCVLDTYEHNGYHDSDFYAVCWDQKKKTIVDIEYDTTRCGGGGWAKVDATDEIIREAYRWYKTIGRGIFDKEENPRQAKVIRKGDTVKVIRGRKIPKNTVGTIFWLGKTYNGYSHREEERVGIELAEGNRVFLPLEYVELVGWEGRLLHGKERKKKIRNFAIRSMPYRYRNHFITNDVYKEMG